jgi:hypothetical protein
VLDPISIDYYYRALAQDLDREVERMLLVIKAEKGCQPCAGITSVQSGAEEHRHRTGPGLNLSPAGK